MRIANVQSEAPRHLASISRIESLPEDGPHDYVYDPTAGYGVDVYVFDTGIYREHPSFENRVTLGMDFTEEGAGDDNGHGKITKKKKKII